MSNSAQIREANWEDLKYLREIEFEAGKLFPADRIPDPNETYPEEALQRALSVGLLFVAISDGGISGFATCTQIDSFIHLDEVSVHPNHGGNGIGKALVRRTIEESVNRSLTGVTLTTFSDFTWNAPFYRKLGFKDVAVHGLPKHVQNQLEIEERLGMINRTGMVYRNDTRS